MKKHLLKYIFLACLYLQMGNIAYSLSLNDVTGMLKEGVNEATVLSAIEAAGAVFQLTDADIKQLQLLGASSKIIDALNSNKKDNKEIIPEEVARNQINNKTSTNNNIQPENADALEQKKANALIPPTKIEDASKVNKTTTASNQNATKELNNQDMQPIPADIKQLRRRYDTGKYASAAISAFELLFTNPKKEYEQYSSTIRYYLAKSLFKLGFYQSAHSLFLSVAKEGTANPHHIGSLSLLTRTSNAIGDYEEFTQLLKDLPQKDLPRRVKSTLLYLIGRYSYEQEDYGDAQTTLSEVAQSSEYYAQAQFLKAMSSYRQGENKKAVKQFKTLVQAKDLVGEREEIKDLKDLSLLNMARIYYRVEDFTRAKHIYELVPKSSNYWAQALFELAYTNFWLGDYNSTLGQLMTIDTPFYKDTTYIPEAKILRALTYYNLCEYNITEALVKNYQKTYTPTRDKIRAFLKEYSVVLAASNEEFNTNDQIKQKAANAYTVLFDPKNPQFSSFPNEIRVALGQERDFKNIHKHITSIRKEISSIKKGRVQWNGTPIGNKLVKDLELSEKLLLSNGGKNLLFHLSRLEKEISGYLGQADIIEFEVADALKISFEDKFKNPAKIEQYDELEESYATESSHIYWPFTGEFWEDELGFYKFTEQGSCKQQEKMSSGAE